MRSEWSSESNESEAQLSRKSVSFCVHCRGHLWIFTAARGDEPSLILLALDLARGSDACLELQEAAELALLISRYLTGQVPETHTACFADDEPIADDETSQSTFLTQTNGRRSSGSPDA